MKKLGLVFAVCMLFAQIGCGEPETTTPEGGGDSAPAVDHEAGMPDHAPAGGDEGGAAEGGATKGGVAEGGAAKEAPPAAE